MKDPLAVRRPALQAGFTYVGVLLLVAVLGLVSAATLRAGVVAQRRVAEQQLIDRGYRVTLALESYARATPAGMSPYPNSLQDLVRDPRFPKAIVRHLRRVEIDPITGKPEWGLVPSPSGKGFTGVHSLSGQKPWRQQFAAPFQDFEDKARYSEWLFIAGLGE